MTSQTNESRKDRSALGWYVCAGVTATLAVVVLAFWLFTWALSGSLWGWGDLDADELYGASRSAVVLVGAVGVGGAAFLGYRKQRSTEDAHVLNKVVQRHIEDRDHEEAHRERLSTLRGRYSTAAEQIAHESFAVRLAGVHSLGSLAEDWHAVGNDSERQVCIDVLCAYLREHTTSNREAPTAGEQSVRNAIIEMIRSRSQQHDGWGGIHLATARFVLPNFHAADLTDAVLDGAYLQLARFTDTELTGAHLVNADLSRSDLSRADLTHADLRGAKMHSAQLRGTCLCGAKLAGADLCGAALDGADLSDAVWIDGLGEARFSEVIYNDDTVWPEGFTPPRSASKRPGS